MATIVTFDGITEQTSMNGMPAFGQNLTVLAISYGGTVRSVKTYTQSGTSHVDTVFDGVSLSTPTPPGMQTPAKNFGEACAAMGMAYGSNSTRGLDLNQVTLNLPTW